MRTCELAMGTRNLTGFGNLSGLKIRGEVCPDGTKERTCELANLRSCELAKGVRNLTGFGNLSGLEITGEVCLDGTKGRTCDGYAKPVRFGDHGGGPETILKQVQDDTR